MATTKKTSRVKYSMKRVDSLKLYQKQLDRSNGCKAQPKSRNSKERKCATKGTDRRPAQHMGSIEEAPAQRLIKELHKPNRTMESQWDPQMMAFLTSITPRLSDPIMFARLFASQNISLDKLGQMFLKDKSHHFLCCLGLVGVEHFDDRRFILRALRSRFDLPRLKLMEENYNIKQRSSSLETQNKANVSMLVPDLLLIPFHRLKQYSNDFRILDPNDKGVITVDDIIKHLEMEPEAAADIVSRGDNTGAGVLDFYGFVKVMEIEEEYSDELDLVPVQHFSSATSFGQGSHSFN